MTDESAIQTVADCEVWLMPSSGFHPALRETVSDLERRRADRYLRKEDRRRSLVAAALLRIAVGRRLAMTPRAVVVDRSCDCGRPHGRPTLPGTDLHASVSHSGDIVAVALAADVAVGIDVEKQQTTNFARLGAAVLTPDERAYVNDDGSFLRYWTRKEAVVKATGDGVSALPRVHVSSPDLPAAVLHYDGYDPQHFRLVDIDTGPGHLGALAVLTSARVRVRIIDACPAMTALYDWHATE